MHEAIAERWGWVDGTHKMRDLVLEGLADADLAFTPGGSAMTLGMLCREIGEIEYAYIQSFKTFTHDFSYRNTEEGIDGKIERLNRWYAQLDAEMETTVGALTEADLNKQIDRGGGFTLPAAVQVDVYLQALLIFLGKATIYLRAMNKPIHAQLESWIG
jgi:hypothetical protein